MATVMTLNAIDSGLLEIIKSACSACCAGLWSFDAPCSATNPSLPHWSNTVWLMYGCWYEPGIVCTVQGCS